MPFQFSRAVLFTGRLWLAYVRVFVIFVIPFCTMLWGWWEVLPWYLHLPLELGWFYCLYWAFKNSAAFPRWPSEFEARRALEHQRNLKHRPVTLQVDRPAHRMTEQQQALWFRAKAWAEKFQPRLLRPEAGQVDEDRFGLRFVALVALLVTLFGVGQSSGLNNLVPIHKLPFISALQPQVEVLVTPPAYADQPAQRWPSDTKKVFVIPGSTIAVRVPATEQSWLTPNLKVTGQVTDLTWKNGIYEGHATITESGRISVRLGWWPIFYGKVSTLADALPTASLAPPIKVSQAGVMNLTYDAADDYGLKEVVFRVYDASTPGDYFDMPLHLPRVGEKKVTVSDTVDLTLNPLAGLPVEIAIVAIDVAGQESLPERLPMTLPERKFYHPVAQKLVAARNKLRDGATPAVALHDIEPLMAAPQAFGDDVRAFLSMAMARAALTHEAKEHRKRAMGFMWDAAVRVEDGPLKNLVQNVLRAQEELSKAIAEGANNAALQMLFQSLQQGMFELLSRAQFGNEAMPDTMNNSDLANLLHQIQELIASGANDRAQELLQQLKQLLSNVQSSGDSAQMQELMQTVQEMQRIMDKQQQLTEQAFQDKSQGQMMKAQAQLAKDTDTLRKKLGKLGLDLPHLQQAAEMMRAAGKAFQGKDATLGQNYQAKAYQILQDAQKAMGEGLRKMLGYNNAPQFMRDPSGRPYGPQDSVDVEGKNPASLSRQIRDQLFERAGEPTRPETEKSYFRRLLESF